jgi:hypothetical protein
VRGLATLAVAALICGCSSRTAQRADPSQEESSPITYETMGLIAEYDTTEGAMARNAIRDGFLTRAEYEAVLRQKEETRKAEVLDRWARPRPRGEQP